MDNTQFARHRRTIKVPLCAKVNKRIGILTQKDKKSYGEENGNREVGRRK